MQFSSRFGPISIHHSGRHLFLTTGAVVEEVPLLEAKERRTLSVATSALDQLPSPPPSTSPENQELLQKAASYRSQGEIDLAFALFRMVAQTTGEVAFWEEALSCRPKDPEFFEELIVAFPSQTTPLLTLGYLYIREPSLLIRARESAPTDPLPLWTALITPPPEEPLLLTAHTLSERFPSLPFWGELTSSLIKESNLATRHEYYERIGDLSAANQILKARVVELEEELKGLKLWMNQIAGDVRRLGRSAPIPDGRISSSRHFTTPSIGSCGY